MQIKLIFTRKVVHLASFWKREFIKLGNGLLAVKRFFFLFLLPQDDIFSVDLPVSIVYTYFN